jgi:hypothetical protein
MDHMAEQSQVDVGPPASRAAVRSMGRNLLQILGTCLVLAWMPGNVAKVVLLLVLWALTFGRLSHREAIAALVICAVFTVMDVQMVERGAFAFDHPDFAGLPAYEFLMWGFYVLHVTRTLGGYAARRRLVPAIVLAVVFSMAFATFSDPGMLAAAAAVVVIVALSVFRDRLDFAYAGYTALVGLLIEYTGVWSSQWHYPAAPVGGVPLWSLPMWAGIGVFVRRIVTPFLHDTADTAR